MVYIQSEGKIEAEIEFSVSFVMIAPISYLGKPFGKPRKESFG